MVRYNVIDLFAGVGGLSYGFSELPEFSIIAANEIDRNIAVAYKLNHPGVYMIDCDIKTLDKNLLEKAIKGENIDLIVGGPPCQSYSTLGKRFMDDRAGLFMQYKRILKTLMPDAFVFENVTGILSMDNGRLFTSVQTEFEELGYILKYKVLDAVNYGVPQHRERVILVGFFGENPFDFPVPTHGDGKIPYISMKDALCDLPILKSGQRADEYMKDADNPFLEYVRKGSQKLTEHIAPKNGEHLIRIMESLKDGQGKDDLPESIRPKSGYCNTYSKLWWDRPAMTITRNFACPSSSRCIHPRDSRAMTVREGARLQSFPDKYVFYGSESTKRLEIGNAVPPLLSKAIAKQMLVALNIYNSRKQPQIISDGCF